MEKSASIKKLLFDKLFIRKNLVNNQNLNKKVVLLVLIKPPTTLLFNF